MDLDLDGADQSISSWDYLISEEQNNVFFPILFWLRQFPIVHHFAFAQIYQRVSAIYDLVSTYIEGITECQRESAEFPFEKNVLKALQTEANHNKKLAQAYLDS